MWRALIQHVQPTGPGSCRVKTWGKLDLYRDGKGPHPVVSLATPLLTKLGRYYGDKILEEDATTCENLQRVVSQVDRPDVFAASEERVRWFGEAYADVTGA